MAGHTIQHIPDRRMTPADAQRFAELVTTLPKDFGFSISRPVQAIDGPPYCGGIQAVVVLPGGGSAEGSGDTLFEAFSRAYIDAHVARATYLQSRLGVNLEKVGG